MHPSLGIQLFSFLGALLILIAYVGHQMHWMNSEGALYNILNAVGSAILGWVAFRPFQLGFVVLEGAWVMVSLYALFRGRRGATTGRA
jgi:hypothetical protein